MPFTSPTNRVTDEVITAAIWNADVAENIRSLGGPPRCRVFNNAAISVAHNTDTPLGFNSERYDTDNMHSTVTTITRITFNTAGTYSVGASVSFPSATGIRSLVIVRNGVTSLVGQRVRALGGGFSDIISCNTVYTFAATDYITATVYQDSGAALNVLSAAEFSPEFWAIWVGT